MKYSNIIFSSPKYDEKFSAWAEHIPFAFLLIEFLKPKVFAELGTHYGVSYFAFCQVINKLKLKSKAYAIDLWTGDEHSGYYGNEVFEYVDKINEQSFSNFSKLLRMPFDDAVENFSDGTVDLLHIDGLHTYKAVKHDFEIWLPKMSSKGVIVFHDTNVYEKGFGVWKLIAELRNIYPSMEFPHGYGLGVVCIGKEVNKEFISFVEKANNNLFVYNLFANLGKKIALKHEVDQFIDKVDNLNDSLGLCKNEIVKLKEIIDEKGTDILRKKAIIEQIHTSYSWRITKPLRIPRLQNILLKRRLNKNKRRINNSGLFDKEYYLKNNPDVMKSGVDPLEHFLQFGGFEGRKPGPEFDTNYYYGQNLDVFESGSNPLLHYILYGKNEGRGINDDPADLDI